MIVRAAYTCKSCGAGIPVSEALAFGLYLGSDASGRLCLRCRTATTKQFSTLEIAINDDGRGKSCDVCHDSLDTIAARQGLPQMRLHLKDGTLQFLCFRCSYAYEESNRRLYQDTLYGWLRKLK